MSEIARDPDNSYDDDVIAELQIKARRNGSMSVAGDIGNLPYALALLDNAQDALRGHHARIAGQAGLIVPRKDVALPARH